MLLALLFACRHSWPTDDPASTDTGPARADWTCDTPIPQLTPEDEPVPSGATSGLVVCEDAAWGVGVNRVEAVVCEYDVMDLGYVEECNVSDGSGLCNTDDECGTAGRCITAEYGCECVHPCHQDADCAADEACICMSHLDLPSEMSVPRGVGECVSASCRTGVDCASGECGASDTCYSGQISRLDCRAENEHDECRTDADCEGYEGCYNSAAYPQWTCIENSCDD